MKKPRLKVALLSLAAVLFCNFTSAQRPRGRDSRPSPERIAQYEAESKRDSLMWTFEHLALKRDFIRGAIDCRLIKRGDSARIKYVFDNSVDRIVVEGGGETTPKDIANGVFVAKVSPEKTKLVNVIVRTRNQFTNKYSEIKLEWLIVVVEPEKYDNIIKEYNKIKEDGRAEEKFITKLSGGTWKEWRTGKVK